MSIDKTVQVKTDKWNGAIPTETGYSCPSCDKYDDSGQDKTLVEMTPPVFITDSEPGYKWEELHRCECNTLYTINNGS